MASAAPPKRTSKPPHTSLATASRRDGRYTGNRRSLRHSRGSIESLQHKRAQQPQNRHPESIQMRSAQQFRVGNVTSNGRLQLRPVADDAQAYPSPPTSPVGNVAPQSNPTFFDDAWRESLPSESAASNNDPVGTALVNQDASPKNHPPEQPGLSRVRSHSFSTAEDHTATDQPQRQSTTNGIKIFVDRPPPKRPVSSVDQSTQLLHISIPHYRLGTPHFSGKGSAVLHSSINTGSSISNGLRSSTLSTRNIDQIFPQPPHSGRRYGDNLKPYSQTIVPSPPRNLAPDNSATTDQQQIGHFQQIEPTALIELESQPSNRHSRSLIRLSRLSGQIVAATPSGLIAQITSPSLLDYELLSDFFLTFRSYMTTHDLNDFLLARLQWAISRSDDFGRIVRVRTFVALRHWILNYFVDDFVSDHTLRVAFCNQVNQLCAELQSRADGGGGDLKILGELKRCWRRTCAQYWEIPEHRSDAATDDILPGRPLGYMSASIHLDTLDSPKPQLNTQALDRPPNTSNAQMDPAQPLSSHPRPFQPATNTTTPNKADPQHRVSDQSAHIVSCSIPLKIGSASKQRPQSQLHRGPQIATTNPPSTGISQSPYGNPLLYHSRTGSFFDAFRDNRATPSEDKPLTQTTASSLSLPLTAGSLVRGYVVQPGQPYVESISADGPTQERLEGENFGRATKNESVFAEDKSSATNPGMKRFFGSVRRALSTRQGTSPTNLSEQQRPATKRSPRESVPLSRSSSHTTYGTPKRQVVGGRTTPRVDMLALCVLERYKSATGEIPNEDSSTHATETQPLRASENSNQYRPALSVPSQQADPRIQSNVTMGSRSIVIVDDTGDRPEMPRRPLTQVSKYGGNANARQSSYSAGDEFRQTIPIGVDTRPATARPYQAHPQSQALGETSSPENNLLPASTSAEQNVTDTTMPQNGSFLNDTENDTEADSDNSLVDTPTATKSTNTNAQSLSVNPRSVRDSIPSHEDPSREPQPQLRRRPGGDLRAVDHVHSLEESQMRPSLRSSSSEAPKETTNTTKDGKPTTSVSVMPTHSSQTVLRPSFEKAMAKLAQVQDDSSDDGGIESTLRKLEGQRVDPTSLEAVINEDDESEMLAQPSETSNLAQSEQHRHREALIESVGDLAPAAASEAKKTKRLSREGSISESDRSDSSIPLLERGVSHHPVRRKKRQSSLDWLTVSLPRGSGSKKRESSPKSHSPTDNLTAENPTRSENDTAQHINRRNNPPKSSSTHKSFLLDDNQSLNGAAQHGEAKQPEDSDERGYTESFYFDDDTSVKEDSDLLPHPLRHPETPPKPRDYPLQTPRQYAPLGPSLAGHISQQDRDAFNARSASKKMVENPIQQDIQSTTGTLSSPLATFRANNGSHLPFILSFDSLLLAQQFTLVEKDALSEVDWRQLIDLQWKTNAKICSTWYDCLKPKSSNVDGRLPGGVDMCITRFNMVVKWAASEIVLCQDMSERVACIIKYIHIARHARQLRNWATMFQITMALVSADIARLKATWQEVPEKERGYLKKLENLITPTRNFHNLREEIDMAFAGVPAAGTDGGCVPFIGIYTHDLIYNAQKPAFAEPAPGVDSEEPLINFERHRTAATIVKNLLRLVDASSKYPFQPAPDVLSRCLWLATLQDEEISSQSRKLEP